jgi:ribosomal protein S12 methylthiotransferase accessory factor
LSTDGIQLVQRMEADPRTGMIARVDLDIQVPAEFPEKYRDALVRAASQCAVKKHLESPPSFQVRTVVH